MSKPRVLVTGATGTIGSSVLRLVAADPTIDVVAATRSSRPTLAIVPTVYLDFDSPETLRPALQNVARAFMMTGYTIKMFRQSRDFPAVAREVEVEHIVHLGTPGDDKTMVEHWLWHQFIERYIEWSGFSFTHLRPDIFMQNLLGYGGAKVVNRDVVRHYVADTRITWIDGEDVAAVAAAVLRNPQGHHRKTYRIGSDVKSFPEIAAILSRVVGQPVHYDPRPPSEILRAVLAADAEAGYMQSVYENYADYTAGRSTGDLGTVGCASNIIGRQPASMEDFISRHRDEFVY